MEKIVVVEERNDGTAGGAEAVRRLSSPSFFLGEHPLSMAFPHLTLEALVVKTRDHNNLDWGAAGKSHGSQRFVEELPPTPGGGDDGEGLRLPSW